MIRDSWLLTACECGHHDENHGFGFYRQCEVEGCGCEDCTCAECDDFLDAPARASPERRTP